jgi:hypothetical protein
MGIKETVNYLKGDVKSVKNALSGLHYNGESLPLGVEDEIIRLCSEYKERQRKKGN